jgi:P-loop containing dynein motor region D4/P-loop containing dynein motor region/AAA+ lid domain
MKAVATTSIALNHYTTASTLRNTVAACLQRTSTTSYTPPDSKRSMILFIDDLHLPAELSTLELARQLIERGHWHQPLTTAAAASTALHTTASGCQYIASYTPHTAAGAAAVSARLCRHFAAFALDAPAAGTLVTLFETVVESHLRSNGFNADVASCAQLLARGALAVHQDVADVFRGDAPAAAVPRCSLRHVARVLTGLLTARSTAFARLDKLVYFWLHECERVYGDCLARPEQVKRFRAIMAAQSKRAFPGLNPQRFYAAAAHSHSSSNGGGTTDSGSGIEPLMFSTVGTAAAVSGAASAARRSSPDDDDDTATATEELQQVALEVDEVGGLDTLRETLEAALVAHNSGNSSSSSSRSVYSRSSGTSGSSSSSVPVLPLVLFDEACLHVLRIARVLQQPGGHMILAGGSGTGKYSLARLAAYVCSMPVVSFAGKISIQSLHY